MDEVNLLALLLLSLLSVRPSAGCSFISDLISSLPFFLFCRQSGQPIRHVADAQLDGLADLQPVQAQRRCRRRLRLRQATQRQRRWQRNRQRQAHQTPPNTQHHSLKEKRSCGWTQVLDCGLKSSSPDRIVAHPTHPPSRKQCCDPKNHTINHKQAR